MEVTMKSSLRLCEKRRILCLRFRKIPISSHKNKELPVWRGQKVKYCLIKCKKVQSVESGAS